MQFKVMTRRLTPLHVWGSASNEGIKIIYRKIKTEFEIIIVCLVTYFEFVTNLSTK